MGVLRRVLVLSLLTLALTLTPNHIVAQTLPADPPVIYLFWGDGCPHCANEHAFLDGLVAAYPQVQVKDFEIWYVAENRDLLLKFGDFYGFEPGSVPTTFIGNQYWIGFGEDTARQILGAVETCLRTGCADVGSRIISGADATTPAQNSDAMIAVDSAVTLPLIGTVTLSEQPLWISTALISLVDGFNPCSLWVLSILLALVIHSGSRKRIVLVGMTFLTVTSVTYIMFIVGLFGIFSFVGYLDWIQIAIALFALGYALINIKDYFWYKEGISLTIADSRKPQLFQNMRGLMAVEKSPLSLIGATTVMALGVTLLELPCTSGMPVLWTNLIASNDVAGGTFIALLALYMIVFLLDEMALFLTVVFTMRAAKFEEKHGRILKLVGGVVMLTLAVVMLIDPEVMNDLSQSLLVFASAIGGTLLILVLHRRVLPHFGIFLGTEWIDQSHLKSHGRRS